MPRPIVVYIGLIVIYRQPCAYTYLGTPYTEPPGGFTVLGQGIQLFSGGEYSPHYGMATRT